MRSTSTSAAMLTILRRALRHESWTARRIAAEFSIGEATAKRWLAGKGLSLERLERLAGRGDVAALVEEPGRDPDDVEGGRGLHRGDGGGEGEGGESDDLVHWVFLTFVVSLDCD